MAHYGDKDGLKVLSYNGLITSVNTNRNYGKTWAFKRRAFRRAMKHGKKTIWLRMFRKELQEVANSFFASRDLQKYCGISVYDKDYNPNGNVKREGYTFFYRTSTKSPWKWFIKIYCLSNPDAVRSADDVDVDTIVFDEYTKTLDKYKRYRGNIVNDFLDIWFSAKREHEVRCILLGNKESTYNPFFSYFGIKPPPTDWQGIRSYRGGSFVIQQINNLPQANTEFENKTECLLAGTSYGNYLYKSDYKTAMPFKARKTPHTATLYVQLYINGTPLKISVLNGYFYVNQRIDVTKDVYTLEPLNKFSREKVLVNRQRPFFIGLVQAYADGRIYYDNEVTREAIDPLYTWLHL